MPRASQPSSGRGQHARKRATSATATTLRASEAKRRATLADARPPLQTVATGALSFLEGARLTPGPSADYRVRVHAFVMWCQSLALTWTSPFGLDCITLSHLDEMFFKGMSMSDGSKLLAAICFFLATVEGYEVFNFPRCRKALKAWARIAPNRMRVPFPWLALAGVLGVLLWEGDIQNAIKLLVQFRTYLRPGALDALLVRQLLPPVASAGRPYRHWAILGNPLEDKVPGKTGEYDLSIVYDSEPWIGPFFEVLTRGRAPNSLLWTANSASTSAALLHGCEVLGFLPLRPCRYALRHGGASDDLLTGTRARADVKARGDWKSDRSVRRYGKQARALDELSKLPPRSLAYGRLVADHLEVAFLRTRTFKPPASGQKDA